MSPIMTVDPENIKALLATQFNDFGKGKEFHDSWELVGIPMCLPRRLLSIPTSSILPTPLLSFLHCSSSILPIRSFHILIIL